MALVEWGAIPSFLKVGLGRALGEGLISVDCLKYKKTALR